MVTARKHLHMMPPLLHELGDLQGVGGNSPNGCVGGIFVTNKGNFHGVGTRLGVVRNTLTDDIS